MIHGCKVVDGSVIGAGAAPFPGRLKLRRLGDAAAAVVAGIWFFHGFFNKLLLLSPRQLAIVQCTPGLAGPVGRGVFAAVGILEVLIAVWVLSARAPALCAATQTVALLSMNVVELTFARHLLLWPAGLIPVNLLFLTAAWTAAQLRRGKAGPRTRLRRHPIPINARLRRCVALTYSAPAEILRPLLPPGLELDTFHGHGFMAVALVQTAALRPGGIPEALGQDFFLVGYRVFCFFRTPTGRRLRGLKILRSDADCGLMVAAGNLLTHYNYHRCWTGIFTADQGSRVTVRSSDGFGDLDLFAHTGGCGLPAGSPFGSIREAMRFAGPMPFTFDYERETHGIVAIRAKRTNWSPSLTQVEVRRISFFEHPMFRGCRPALAAAFEVGDVEYRWERGVWYPLPEPGSEKNE